MNINDFTNKTKELVGTKTAEFKELSTTKKISLVIATVAIIAASIFGFSYLNESRYSLLFSQLDSTDAIIVTKELESQGIDMKIKGSSIYVPKGDVDRLRLELSGELSNGSKGFELMDEGSSFGLTDEEFQIKRQRMLQGELEKTIKSFEQVESARVHLMEGETSVFSTESTEGSAAVSLVLKSGTTLGTTQVNSIVSLVSAAGDNIPKQNVEVVDQYMNLLTDGLFDEDGNLQSSTTSGLLVARTIEKELNSDLEKAISALLTPMFGDGNVLVKVYADLNFDANEITEIKIGPDRVALEEYRNENGVTVDDSVGGTIDNNMNSVGGEGSNQGGSLEEKTSYEADRKETKTVKARGEINRMTVSVAIDADLDAEALSQVQDIVSNAIGYDTDRGDSISVVAMNFDSNNDEQTAASIKEEMTQAMKTVGISVGGILILIAAILVFMLIKKKKAETYSELDDNEQLDMINKKIQEIEKARNPEEATEQNITLEEEVKQFAVANKDKVKDLINNWLNE